MRTAFHDLPADAFPLTMRAFDAQGAEVWTETVTGPGALFIPPLADTHGPVRIRVEFANGEVQEGEPPP